MRTLVAGILPLLFCAASLHAQSEVERERARVEELDRHAVEIEDLIRRHARGEDVSRSRWLELDERGGRNEQTLQLTENETRAMRKELERLQQLRAARREEKERREEGDSRPRREEVDRAVRPEAAAKAATASPPPGVRVEASAATSQSSGSARVQGSTDHRRVGLSMLRAGLDLRTEARALAAEGRVAAAAAREELARSRLLAAHAELEPLGRTDTADAIDVFTLARCEEALGNLDRADELYTETMARDRHVVAGIDKGFGPVGRAASTARAVLSWLRESGDWRPRRNVDDLVLPGR
ncbi:MAG: hypothetical protein U1F36_16610 [Planctomycetota bacterium]